jgi:hypothetical protein
MHFVVQKIHQIRKYIPLSVPVFILLYTENMLVQIYLMTILLIVAIRETQIMIEKFDTLTVSAPCYEIYPDAKHMHDLIAQSRF